MPKRYIEALFKINKRPKTEESDEDVGSEDDESEYDENEEDIVYNPLPPATFMLPLSPYPIPTESKPVLFCDGAEYTQSTDGTVIFGPCYVEYALPPPSIIKRIVYGVPEENPEFINRQKLMDALTSQLDEETTTGCRVVALHGLAGRGKTQLILRYVYQYSSKYDYVIWMENITVDSFCKFAKKYNIVYIDADDVIENVGQWFLNSRKWLLILDNVNDLDKLQNVLDCMPKVDGRIIIGSGIRPQRTMAGLVHVDILDKEEALHFLLGVDQRNISDDMRKSVEEFAQSLGYEPSIMNFVRDCINFDDYQLEEYIELYYNEQLPDVVCPIKYIQKVWLNTLEVLKAKFPKAIRILEALTDGNTQKVTIENINTRCIDDQISSEDLRFNVALLQKLSLLNVSYNSGVRTGYVMSSSFVTRTIGDMVKDMQ